MTWYFAKLLPKNIVLPECLGVCYKGSVAKSVSRSLGEERIWAADPREFSTINRILGVCCPNSWQRWVLLSSTCSFLPASTCVHHIVSEILFFVFLHKILTVLYFPVFRSQKLKNNLSFWNHICFYSYWLPLCQKSQICESCFYRRHQRVSCPSLLQQARSHVRTQIKGKHKTFTSSAVVIII